MELFSLYTNQKATVKKDISVQDYLTFIRVGTNQDLVLAARAEYQKNGKTDLYKSFKNQSQCITGSAVMNPGSKTTENINSLNGLIVLDVDVEVDSNLRAKLCADKYTYILHSSFSGDGICVFIKINPERFLESFNQLAQYYFSNFNITIDQACKNKNRLRYLSYDPDVFFNEKAQQFKAKLEPKPKRKEVPIFSSLDDFEFVLKQINDRGIDLIKGEYERYIRIGFALFSEFGADKGKQYFEFINQFNSKFQPNKFDKEWKSLCKEGSTKIGTFYHYCKEEGIEIFTPRTKEIINRVKVAKSKGEPNLSQISENLKALDQQPLTGNEIEFTQKLIDSPIDLSVEANKDVSEIEQIEKFILEVFEPKKDVLTDVTYIKGAKRLTDTEINDIYISCKKNFDFTVPISDVRSILNSSVVPTFNSVNNFFNEYKGLQPNGVIEAYIKCIEPYTEFNLWAFKKWLVGAVHNWTSPDHEKLVCPLTLVLTGQKHGTGKTSFLRHCLPKELEKYAIETKINAQDKDSLYYLGSNLLVLDDEFGGKAFKDVKEYKAISDVNLITQRRPYASTVSTFKRRAILCGTSNETDVLKDVTGNRRILPIRVERIDFDAMLKIDKVDLLMEAYNLYNSGFEWKIYSKEDIDYLAENTSENNAVIPLEEYFLSHFKPTAIDRFTFEVIMNQGELLEWFHLNTPFKPTKFELKEIFVKNKMEYKVFRDGNGLKKGYKLFKFDTSLPF